MFALSRVSEADNSVKMERGGVSLAESVMAVPMLYFMRRLERYLVGFFLVFFKAGYLVSV